MATHLLVRPAELTDFETVTAMLEELGRPRVKRATEQAARQVYREQLECDDFEHLLALCDEQPVGFCSLEFRSRLNYSRPQAWIADLIVAAPARRRGVARTLLAEAERRAWERKCWSITLESGHERKAAHALYAELGWADVGKAFGRGAPE
jgi:GNAT superfamily N-acetyltransferase